MTWTDRNTPWRADGWYIRDCNGKPICELSPVVFREDVNFSDLAKFIVKTVNDATDAAAETSHRNSW